MKILRFTKRNQNARLKDALISDVNSKNTKTFLDLRHRVKEKVPIVEIHFEELLPFFHEHKKQLSIIGIALVFFSSFSFIFRSKASVVEFYPSSCLGGWQYSKNAEGAPTLSEDAPLEDYTIENSALLGNSSAEIYCGSFNGEIPKDVLAKNFKLAFRWSVDDGSVLHELKEETVTGGGSEEVSSDIVNEQNQENQNAEKELNVEIKNEPIIENVETTSDVPITPISTDQSFLNIFMPSFVHAEDEVSQEVSVQEIVVSEPVPQENKTEDVAVETKVDEVPIAEKSPEIPAEGVVTITENNETEPEENNLEQVAQDSTSNEVPFDAFATISYTLDGEKWNSLGVVTQSNWRNSQFELPLGDWEDLSKLQVSIKPIQTLDRQPVVYLNAMQISVGYEEGVALDKPTVKVKNEVAQVIEGDFDFSSDESPVFAIVAPSLSKNDLTDLVIEKKAEVVLDKDDVLEIDKKKEEKTQDEKNSEEPKVIETINEAILSSVPEIKIEEKIENSVEVIEGAPIEKIEENTTEVKTDKKNEEVVSPISLFSPLVVHASAGVLGGPNITEAKIYDLNGELTDIKAKIETVTINGESRLGVRVDKPTIKFRPGKYTLEVTVETLDSIIITQQDFTWGVLAINTDKSFYQEGDEAYIQFGVLNDRGSTICGADLDLKILIPNGEVVRFSTEDKTIIREEQCGPNNVISVPDYYANFKLPKISGTYKMSLTAVTTNGTKKITDKFEVGNPSFDISRTGPTRIYPLSTYPMTIRVTAKDDWSGSIVEKVPADFGVFKPKRSQEYDTVSTIGEATYITWVVDLKKGEEMTLGYIFKAPEISPEFYLLGELALYTSGTTPGVHSPFFSEVRKWQVANDAVCGTTSGLTSGNWDGTSPVGAGSVWTGCTGAGGIPGSGDVVTINAGATITLNVNAPASGTLGAFTVAGTLTNGGSYTLTTGTTSFTVNNGGTFSAGSGTITSGVIVTNGTYNANSATINVTSPVTTSTLLSIGSTGVFDAGSANITLVFGQLSGSTILSLTAGGSFVGGTSTITEGVGAVGSGGTGTATLNAGDFTGSNKLNNFAMNNHSSGIIVLASNIELSGTFTKTSGTFKTDATCTGSLGYDMIVSNFVISASGGAADNLCASDITFTGSGTLLARSTFTLTATNANFIIKSDSSPTIFSGNAVTFTDLTFSPVLTASRTYTMGTAPTVSGNVTSNPTSSSTSPWTLTLPTTPTFGATKTFTVTGDTYATTELSANLSIGFLSIGTNGILSPLTRTITLTATSGPMLTLSGGTFTRGTSTILISGGNNVVLNSSAFTGSNKLYNLTLNTTGAKTLGADLELENLLTVTQGTLNTDGTSNYALTAGSISIASSVNAILTLNSSVLTLNGTSGTLITKGANGVYNGTTATLNVTSDASVTFLSSSGSTVTFGNINFIPVLTGNKTYTIGSTPTVSSATLTINPTGSGNTLTVSPNATVTMGSTSTLLVKGSGGATGKFDTTGSNYAVATGFLSVDSGGYIQANASTITVSGTTGPVLSYLGGTFDADTSTVTIVGAGSYVPNTSGFTGTNKFYNLTLNSISTTKTLGADIELEGTLLVTAGTLDTDNTNNYAITAGFINVASSANAFFTARASVITLNGTSGTLFTKGANGTFTVGTSQFVIASASGTPSFLNTALTFHKVKIDSTATVINEGAALTINNVSGAELYVKNGVFNTNLALTGPGSGNGTLQIDSGGTLCLGGTVSASNTSASCDTGATSTTARAMPTFQTYTFATGSTVNYLSDAATTVSSTPTYGNLKIQPVLTVARTYTLGGTMTINGDFTINPNAASALALTVNAASAGGNITVGSTKTTTISRQGSNATSVLDLRPSATDSTLSTGSINIATGGTLDLTSFTSTVTVAGSWTKNGTFTITSGTPTVDLTTSTTGTITGATTFYNLTKSGAGTVTLAAAITVNNNLTISSGTLDDAGFQITGNATGNLTMSSGTILILGTTGTATTFPTGFTNAHCPIDAGSTVTYNATVAQTVSGVPNYGGLRLSAASGTPTKTLGAQVTINSTLTIDANNTLDVGSGLNYGIILAGNFTNNGTFTAQAGTVSLVGTTTQTLTGNFTSASSSALYNLTISNTSGADPSGAEVTGMTASVSFASALTATNNFNIAPTCTSTCTRVQYNNGSTYTFTNITWTGNASHKIYFRNSVTSGTWLLKVTGTQSVTNVDVSRSDASVSGGSSITATGGTNVDSGNNTNWIFYSVNISGNAYNDGATTTWTKCNGSTSNVSLSVNGGTPSTTTCNASTGAYTFSSIGVGSGSVLHVFFNTNGANTDQGVAITKLTTGTPTHVTGLNPHKGYVWVQNESGSTSVTNTNLDLCDSGVSGCTNVPFTVTGGALTLTAGFELRIDTTGTFAPGGDVTAYNINIAGSGTYTGNTETITLNGTTGTLLTRAGTFTQGTTEVVITSSSGTPTLLSAATTFHKLKINSAATVINDGAVVTINNASGARLYIQSGVLNMANQPVGPGSGNGTLQIDSSSTLCLGGTTSATNATCDSGATQTSAITMPTFQTYTFAAGSTTGGWYNASWGYRTKITIDHTKVPSTQTDFPVLISKTDNRFRTVANGGHMGNSGATDMVVTSSDGTTKLNHQVEYYAATTGEIVVWVKVPSLSSSTDTDLYLYYGNAGVADQQNVTGTWNSNFKQVLHVSDGTTLSVTDSTGSYNGTNSGGTAVSGYIDGGVDFNLSSHIANGATLYTMIGGSNAHTISFWINMDDFSGGDQYVWDGDTALGLGAFMNIAGAGIIQWGFTAGGYRSYSSTPISSTGTWYYIVAQKSASGDNGKLYVNGTLQSSYTGTLGNPANTGSSNSQWGRYHATSLSADGKMDEMRVLNIATSADWITTEYNNQSAPSTFIPTWATEETGSIPAATVVYLSNADTTISNTPTYQNLYMKPVLTASRAYTFGGAVNISADFTISPNASSAYALTVNPAGTITVASGFTTTISRQGSNATSSLYLRPVVTSYDLSTGLLSIGTGGTLDGSSATSTITLTGVSGTLFTRNGTFTQGNTTVTVTSASGTPTLLSAATTFHILTINAGATVVNSGFTITIEDTSGAGLTITSGVLNDSGLGISTSGSSNNTLTIGASGTLCLGGASGANTSATCDTSATSTTTRSMPSFATYTFNASSTVIYLSDAATTISQTPTYGNLKFMPVITTARTYTMGGATTINGSFTINPNSSGSNALTVNAGGDITVATTGTTTITRQGGSATSVLSLRPSSTNYNLSTGYLTVATGGTLTCVSTSYTGTITLSGTTGTLFTKAGTFTEGNSTVSVTSASGTPTLLSASTTFYILKIATTGATIVNQGATLITDNTSGNKLWINAGVFNMEGQTITAGTAGTLQVDSGATLCLGGTTSATSATCDSGATQTSAIAMPSFTTYTFDNASNIVFLSNADTTISSTPTYGNLKFMPVLTSAGKTYTLGGAMTINGDFSINPNDGGGARLLTVNAGGTITVSASKTTTITRQGSTATSSLDLRPSSTDYNLSTGLLNIATGGTLDGTSASSTISLTGTSGTLFTRVGTFTAGTTTVQATGNGSSTLNSGTITFYAFTLNSTGTKTLGANITVDPASTLTITVGTLDTASGSNYQISAGKISIANSSSAILTANASAIGITGTSGTLLTRGASGVFNGGTSIVTLSGNGTATVNSGTFTSGNKFYDFVNSGTGTKTLGGAIEVQDILSVTGGTLSASSNNITTASLSIGASGTLDGGSATITDTGNWTNSGTFTSSTSTVLLSGSSQQTISGTLTGSTGQFYNLTITNSSGTDASDGERTSFVPGVIFADPATSTNNYTITTGSVRVEYESASTYTFNNINWNGGSVGTEIFFRNSIVGTPDWKLKVTGTQTGAGAGSVSFVDVSHSDASVVGGNTIIASDGTNIDSGSNTNWQFVAASLTFDISSASVAFGALSTGSVASGSHTIAASTLGTGGFLLTYKGGEPTLIGGSATIAGYSTPTIPSAGTEGFGINLGDGPTTTNSGTCTIASNYNTSGSYMFVPNTTTALTSISAPADCIFTATYKAAISGATDAGSYSTPITYIATGQF